MSCDTAGSSRESLPEKRILHNLHKRALLAIGRTSMSALDVFIVVRCFLSSGVIQQFCHHLASVTGMHAVILRGGGEQGRWIRCLLANMLIRRVLVQEVVPVLGVRISVFPHPACSGKEVAVPLHIQQRNLADDRTKQLVALRPSHHVAYKEAAIRAPLGAKFLTASDSTIDDIFSYSLEVLVCLVAICFQCCLVPARTVFSASSDVCIYPHTTSLEPSNATRRCINRG
mmetsp:Transcript_76652/g.135739  ORF Transcript_76652/g.135739 Transcript_76652/m.135739 type:complete len:229 (+) Transcript_76652:301-987(+)